jgi:hypothetical protein
MKYLIKFVPRRWIVTQVIFGMLDVRKEREFRFSARTDEEAVQIFLKKTRDAGSASLFKEIAYALPAPDPSRAMTYESA